MSISTCSTESNPNISLSGRELSNLKNSMNYQLSNSIALPSKILIYNCVVERSKSKNFNQNWITNCQILLIYQSQILKYYCVGRWSVPKNVQIVLVLPSQILIYHCVGEESKLKNFKYYELPIVKFYCFTKSNHNILLQLQSRPKSFK